MSAIDVSVIIVSFNTKELTLQSIQSIVNHTKDLSYQIIVVDNNSQDGSQEAILRRFPETILVENKENVGFGAANNQGIKIAKGRYVFLLNSDAYITDNALLTFMLYMDDPENSHIAVSGAELSTGGEHHTLSYGNFPTLFEAFSACGPYIFYKDYFAKHISGGVVNYDSAIKVVDYITGADMFIRKSVLDKVGLFDEDFFMYFEDTELSFRIKKAGFTSVILPYIKIVHLVSAVRESKEKVNFKKVRIFEKSRKMYYEKCYGQFAAILSNIVYALQRVIWGILGKEREWVKKAWVSIST